MASFLVHVLSLLRLCILCHSASTTVHLEIYSTAQSTKAFESGYGAAITSMISPSTTDSSESSSSDNDLYANGIHLVLIIWVLIGIIALLILIILNQLYRRCWRRRKRRPKKRKSVVITIPSNSKIEEDHSDDDDVISDGLGTPGGPVVVEVNSVEMVDVDYPDRGHRGFVQIEPISPTININDHQMDMIPELPDKKGKQPNGAMDSLVPDIPDSFTKSHTGLTDTDEMYTGFNYKISSPGGIVLDENPIITTKGGRISMTEESSELLDQSSIYRDKSSNITSLRSPSMTDLRVGMRTVDTNVLSEGHQLSVPTFTIGAKRSTVDDEMHGMIEMEYCSDSDGSTTREIMCGLSGTPY